MKISHFTPLAAGLLILTGCSVDEGEVAQDGQMEAEEQTAPRPTPTVTETVTRAPDPEVESAGANDEAQADAGALQDAIPARFHGDWSEDLDHCGIPGHQRYDIRAKEVGFFESTGIVQNVRADGNYAAATLSEQYGDAPPAVYVFYMAIEDENTMRIRYDDNPRIRIYRCPN